jgi:hypothetical protein
LSKTENLIKNNFINNNPASQENISNQNQINLNNLNSQNDQNSQKNNNRNINSQYGQIVYNNNNINNTKNKCFKCNSFYIDQKKILQNICNNCLSDEITNQVKKYYINYLVLMKEKINQIKNEDLNIFFLDEVSIIVDNNKYTIYQIIEDILFNTNKDKHQFLKKVINWLKIKICLHCYKDIDDNNCQFRIGCGCNFCSKEHINLFFRNTIGNNLTYNYKCLCTYEYSPNEIFKLCVFLYKNDVYGNNQRFITHLENLFKSICCKCGCPNNKLLQISVDENFLNNFIHKICDNCLNKNNGSILNECILCKKKHKFICIDY